MWIKIHLADSIQYSFIMSVSCQTSAIGGGVHKIIVWRWFSFLRIFIYKASESGEFSQRRMGHTYIGGWISIIIQIKMIYIKSNDTEVWKVINSDLGLWKIRTSMQWRESGKYRLRTVASSGWPMKITEVFKHFQKRTIVLYSFQTRFSHWIISCKANAPYLRARCNEGYA